MQDQYRDRGVNFVAICSNNAGAYPEDSFDNMKRRAQEQGYNFPYLHDETQEVARAYSAACTPDFFLFDKEIKLYYRGQLDNSRPNNGIPVTGKDLRNAMDSLLEGAPPPDDQKSSMGCNIKWTPGNEPHYFVTHTL